MGQLSLDHMHDFTKMRAASGDLFCGRRSVGVRRHLSHYGCGLSPSAGVEKGWPEGATPPQGLQYSGLFGRGGCRCSGQTITRRRSPVPEETIITCSK